MTLQLARKAPSDNGIAPEAQQLQRLREEASKIARQVEQGTITREQGADRLRELANRHVGLGYRIFGF
jgi:hypothetical protein